MSRQIGIRLGGALRAVSVQELRAVPAPDGAPLRAVRISFEVMAPDDLRISRELHQASSRRALVDEVGAQWWVTHVSSERQDSEDTRKFTVDLREEPRLRRIGGGWCP